MISHAEALTESKIKSKAGRDNRLFSKFAGYKADAHNSNVYTYYQQAIGNF